MVRVLGGGLRRVQARRGMVSMNSGTSEHDGNDSAHDDNDGEHGNVDEHGGNDDEHDDNDGGYYEPETAMASMTASTAAMKIARRA